MKKKARTIRKALPAVATLNRIADREVTAAARDTIEKNATKQFQKAVKDAMKQYATTIRALAVK